MYVLATVLSIIIYDYIWIRYYNGHPKFCICDVSILKVIAFNYLDNYYNL